jgi:hypothetical protein
MADLTVANTILQQLGGNRFRIMTGARDFVGTENSLTFKIPVSNKVTHVVITLEPDDTYKMEFLNCRDGQRKVLSTHEDVYFDMLEDIFTSETGLYTRL